MNEISNNSAEGKAVNETAAPAESQSASVPNQSASVPNQGGASYSGRPAYGGGGYNRQAGGGYRPRPTYGGSPYNRPAPGGAPGQQPGQTPGSRPFGPKQEESEHRINSRIRVPKVRLVGDNVENPGIYNTADALHLADTMDLDLVEISPNADPPVCKILDYQKFLYQQKKKAKELKAKATKVEVKELRFGPNTDDHDYDFKLRHAREFLQEGSKVKAYVFFKGRSILFKEQGKILLLRFAQDLEDLARLDQMPRLEGKRMIIMLSPKPKK